MFDALQPAPPDAIFGLTEAFRRDPRTDKLNLGVGVYKDAEGRTPIFAAVLEAERRLLSSESTKSYLPMDGLPRYAERVLELLLGEGELLASGRAVSLQAPGGTGALRAAAELVRRIAPETTVWLSQPTWPNHPQVFSAAGLRQQSYRYFDAVGHRLDFDAMLTDLGQARAGDLVLVHGCCHNPTGVDLSAEQWQTLAELLTERGLTPLVDFAYQGFGHGLRDDVAWLPILAARVPELMVASSLSKNFGLYNERTGALTVVTPSAERSSVVLGQLKRTVRAIYSNPPAHGALVAAEILASDELRRLWESELDGMRQRIHRLRRSFAEGLDRRQVQLTPGGNGFLVEQNGMFSFSGLGPGQVEWLRSERGIFIVGSGRINVAGIRETSIDPLCDAVAESLRVEPAAVG